MNADNHRRITEKAIEDAVRSKAVEKRLQLLQATLELAELEVGADEAWARMLVEEFGEETAAEITALTLNTER